MKKILILLFLPIIVFQLPAIDEDRLNTAYDTEIRPFIETETSEGRIQMADGAILAYRSMMKPEARVIMVLLGGHTESYVKYAELFYDLRDLNMSLYALDQRGQGFSSRMLPDPEKDHIDDYNSYIDDLDSFITGVVKPGEDEMVLLLGHSFGAAVAAAYAQRYPESVAGLILSSPYISSKAGPLAMLFLRIIDFFGGAQEYVPGGGPFTTVGFEANKETHSRARHERKMEDYAEYPQIRLGHPTNRWMLETERLGREVRKNAGKISCPVLVFQAGHDEYARRRTQDRFIAGVVNCRSVMLDDAYHEILIETDAIRDTVLKEIRDFIEPYLFRR